MQTLASTTFQHVGLFFAVPPDNGHCKSRQQLQQAWQWAGRHLQDPLKHLEVYMLQCLLQMCLDLKSRRSCTPSWRPTSKPLLA